MKNLKILLLLNLLIVSISLNAQITHHNKNSSASNTMYPEFTDMGKFRNDLKTKIDFKAIYKRLQRDSVFDAYEYNFEVTKEGKVSPEYNYTYIRLKEIRKFIQEIFNNYRWKPRYEKNSEVISHLTLCIFLYTDTRTIKVFIETRKTNKKLFSEEILFDDLK